MMCAAAFIVVALALLGTPSLARDLPGGMPGGLPGGLPGGNPGILPGGNPGELPGGNPFELPGGNPGELPGGNPGELPGGNPFELPGGNPEEIIAADCFQSKMDNYGGDLPGGEVSASSAEECQEMCQKKSGCKFFTYIKKASWGSNKCFLKGSNVQLKACDVCVTGPANCGPDIIEPPKTCANVHCPPGQTCKDGDCQKEEPSCMCAGHWDPVCGSDGETHSNSGCAICENAEVVCSGQCPCSDPCDQCLPGQTCQEGKCIDDVVPGNEFCPELKNLVSKYC
jgi:hypothetical protein